MSNNRLAIVTGATGGIGFAVARRLGQAGFTVVLNGIEDEEGAKRMITPAMITSLMRRAITFLGVDKTGLLPHQVGTHSVRCGVAMSRILSGCPAWQVMLMGRWRSMAFLEYVREQVQSLRKDASQAMIGNKEFYQLPIQQHPEQNVVIPKFHDST